MNKEEWLNKRLGKFTASQIYLLLKLKESFNKSPKTAQDYVIEKAAEILSGQRNETYVSKAMLWGINHEAEAAAALKERYPKLEHMGGDDYTFWEYSSFSGASPDGAIPSENTIIEIKCPYNMGNHIWNLSMSTQEELKKVRPQYYTQVQFNMMCFAKQKGIPATEVAGVFCSYDPRMLDDSKKLHTIFVQLSEEEETAIKRGIAIGTDYLSQIIKSL